MLNYGVGEKTEEKAGKGETRKDSEEGGAATSVLGFCFGVQVLFSR